MIRKSSIRTLTELKINSKIASILKGKEFVYVKSKSEFKRKVGDYENVFSIQIPIEAIRFNKNENKYILWFELYSHIRIPKFDKWFKKNTKNEIRVYSKLKRINGYIILRNEDLTDNDFFTPSETRKYKHEMLNNLLGDRPNIKESDSFNLEEFGAGLLNTEADELKDKSDLESFLQLEKNVVFNRYHVTFLNIEPYLFSFKRNIEMAKKHFENSYRKYVSMFPNLKNDYKNEFEYFLIFFESFLEDSKKLVGVNYPNNIPELKAQIKE